MLTGALLCSVLLLGVSAGAMLAEQLVMVPDWQQMPPETFLAWFAAHEAGLTAFYGPLQASSAIVTLVAFGLFAVRRRPGLVALGIAAACAVAVLALFGIYFRDANQHFVDASIAVTDVPQALVVWARWQWLRIGFGMAAFLAALFALRADARLDFPPTVR